MRVVTTIACSWGDGHWYPVTIRGKPRRLKPGSHGYVMTCRGASVRRRVHRHFYEAIVGEIPAGLVPDHLCRDRACCAPAHIQPVSNAVNVGRGASHNRSKTHCAQGHAFSLENTQVVRLASGATRRCKACRRRRDWVRSVGRPAYAAAQLPPLAATHAEEC